MDRRAQGVALLELAKTTESAGNYMEAVELYRQAFKLWPELENEEYAKDAAKYAGLEEQDAFAGRENPFESISRTVPEHYKDIFRTFPAADLDTADGRETIRQYFQSEGYVVVRDVLTAAEVDTALHYFADYLRKAADIDVRDLDSVRLQRFGDNHAGIIGRQGAGHTLLNWFVRSRGPVKNAFRTLLWPADDQQAPAEAASTATDAAADAGRKKLICSFDGMGFFRNPEAHDDFKGNEQPWLHVDAGDEVSSRYMQGIVNLVDCRDDMDAGLVVVPRSHRDNVFKVICPEERAKTSYGYSDFDRAEQIKVMKLHTDAQLQMLKPFRIPLPAGSVAIWSGKVLHCNVGCGKRDPPRPEQLIRRVVCYVCMVRDPADPELTAARKQAFNAGRTTTHQPDRIRSHGAAAQDLLQSGVLVTREVDLPDGALELL
jgi:hypothetical protein